MKTKHTPGPWTIHGDLTNPRNAYTIRDLSGDTLAAVRLECVHSKIADANARLIAAAPDLLAVLESVLWRWDRDDERDNPELGAEIRAAIAKAKGEA